MDTPHNQMDTPSYESWINAFNPPQPQASEVLSCSGTIKGAYPAMSVSSRRALPQSGAYSIPISIAKRLLSMT
jgi:hypothetical protein